jgi:hypothetical protein
MIAQWCRHTIDLKGGLFLIISMHESGLAQLASHSYHLREMVKAGTGGGLAEHCLKCGLGWAGLGTYVPHTYQRAYPPACRT